MCLEKGQRFTIRAGGATAGTGVITEILPGLTDAEKALVLAGKKGLEKLKKKELLKQAQKK